MVPRPGGEPQSVPQRTDAQALTPAELGLYVAALLTQRSAVLDVRAASLDARAAALDLREQALCARERDLDARIAATAVSRSAAARAGAQRARDAGRPLGRPRIDEATAAVVARSFFECGGNCAAVADALTAAGVCPPGQGTRWHENTVRRIALRQLGLDRLPRHSQQTAGWRQQTTG